MLWFRYVGIVYMRIVHHINKKIAKFEMLLSSRRIKLFKTGMRTCAHVDVEGTGKTLVFIAKRDGQFFHYMEDHWHPRVPQHVFMIGKIKKMKKI